LSVDKLREANTIFLLGEEEQVEETTSLNAMRRGTVKPSFGEWRGHFFTGFFIANLLHRISLAFVIMHA
jgi:hypothetical protein